MIVLPSLAGFFALLQMVLEATLLGVIFGAAFGGSQALVTEVHEHGEINQEVMEEVADSAVDEATEGAIGGALTGGIFGVFRPVFQPILNLIDDILRSIFGLLDDAARGVAKVADDAVKGLDDAANSAANGIRGLFNRVRNGCNVFRNCTGLPAAPEGKNYVYVIYDAAKGIYKIGITGRKPKERLDDIARAIKRKADLDFTCIIETNADSGLEGILHREFKSVRQTHSTPHSGATEWFALTAAQVARACSH